ncbi:MAG: phosphate signaling complex protein PhoU [Deltaproteobacteria bacterium]|jgi:phosphate transport system protein|nr:phosphate signaling complex protein PhoU [Deltaproteobacteria bacterium]
MSAGIFVRELDKVKNYLTEMGEDVLRMLKETSAVISKMDVEKAKEIIKFDKTVNELENRVVNKAIDLIALNQPVAGDLRFLASSLRLSTELERIGDLAGNISRRVLDIHKLEQEGKETLPFPDEFTHMIGRTLLMLEIALDSFKENDAEAAHKVMGMDDEVDDYNRSIRKKVLDIVEKDGKSAAWGFEAMTLAGHVERLADHTTNLAEETIYMARGFNIRHQITKDREEI